MREFVERLYVHTADSVWQRVSMKRRAQRFTNMARSIRSGNAVAPGFIRTAHGIRELEELTAMGVDVSEAAIAAQQGRLCEPEEVAKAALFLASDDASFVSGAHLYVDNCFSSV